MLVNKKMKLLQLIFASAFLATLILPAANATINVQSVTIPNVVASGSPLYGSCRFNIVVNKTTTQEEFMQIPVVVNGTTLSEIGIAMKANEISKIVSANVTLPGAAVLMTNPFATFNPISANYTKLMNPFQNPISSKQYDIKVGSFTKNVTMLVYADWSIWAIIVDILAWAAVIIFITRALRS
jgi:hypothetical protein